jgi:hypothetical protein
MKKRIWFDIDEVLCDFEQGFYNYFRMPNHPPDSWDDHRIRDNIHRVYYINEFWINLKPLIKPEDISFDIMGYCTHRHCYDHITASWLRIHGFPKREIINVNHLGITKGKALMDKCDIFLDDGFHNFEDVRNHGVECYLMSREHNKHQDVGEYRVNSVKEFGEKINGTIFQERKIITEQT